MPNSCSVSSRIRKRWLPFRPTKLVSPWVNFPKGRHFPGPWYDTRKIRVVYGFTKWNCPQILYSCVHVGRSKGEAPLPRLLNLPISTKPGLSCHGLLFFPKKWIIIPVSNYWGVNRKAVTTIRFDMVTHCDSWLQSLKNGLMSTIEFRWHWQLMNAMGYQSGWVFIEIPLWFL